jgi:predicted acetyltransferase
MKIINYFTVKDKDYWLNEIKKCNWRDAMFLSNLLTENTFHEILGIGNLYLLIDYDQLLCFGTLTEKDYIEDKGLHPWIGFIFTQPTHRGHRYSQKIINQMLSDAVIQGYSYVYLATEHIGLYEKYGFSYLENRKDKWGINNRIYFKKII